MPSQYRPQILGWIDDLDKGTNYLSGADDRLLYANDNYCAFLRKTSSDQIFYLCIFTIVFIGLIPTNYLGFLILSDTLDKKDESLISLVVIIGQIASFFI